MNQQYNAKMPMPLASKNSIDSVIQTAEAPFKAIISTTLFDVCFERECYYLRTLAMKNWNETTNNYKYAIASCTPASIQLALISCAHTGLSLNPILKQAYLVPRYNTKSNQVDCTLVISWRGLIQIGVQQNVIKYATPVLVYETDLIDFQYNGPHEKPYHPHDPFNSQRGCVVGGYCITILASGDTLCTTLSQDDFDKIRPTHGSVWDSNEEAMMKKSLIRHAFNSWPLTINLKHNDYSEGLTLGDGEFDQYIPHNDESLQNPVTINQNHNYTSD